MAGMKKLSDFKVLTFDVYGTLIDWSGMIGYGATMNPGDLPSYDFRFDSMAAMVDAHRAEIG